MTGSKYDRYFIENPWGINHPGTDPQAPRYIGLGQEEAIEGWDIPFTQVLRPIYYAYEMIPQPHKHPAAEILYFIGGNPLDFEDFGAEVEFTIGEGEESEKRIITKTTWVYVPANVPHCPLNFRKIEKPIMFGHIMFSSTYQLG